MLSPESCKERKAGITGPFNFRDHRTASVSRNYNPGLGTPHLARAARFAVSYYGGPDKSFWAAGPTGGSGWYPDQEPLSSEISWPNTGPSSGSSIDHSNHYLLVHSLLRLLRRLLWAGPGAGPCWVQRSGPRECRAARTGSNPGRARSEQASYRSLRLAAPQRLLRSRALPLPGAPSAHREVQGLPSGWRLRRPSMQGPPPQPKGQRRGR